MTRAPPRGSKSPGNLAPAAQDLHVPSAGPPKSPGLMGASPGLQLPEAHRPPSSAGSALVPPHPDPRALSLSSSGCHKGPAKVTLELASPQQNLQKEEPRSRLVMGRTAGKRRASNTPKTYLHCGPGGAVSPGAGGRTLTRASDSLCAHFREEALRGPLTAESLPAALHS